MTSTALERTVDTVCLIASVVFLYLLPYRISILFYLLFGCSAFLFCIGFFRLVATIDEPSLPETAYLTGLTFMVGGMAVNACGDIWCVLGSRQWPEHYDSYINSD